MQDFHLDFDAPPDPSNVMAMLNSMPVHARDAFMEAAAQMMPKSDPLSQEVVWENWKKVKADFAKGGIAKKMMGEKHVVHFTTTQSWNVKQGDQSAFSVETIPSSAVKSLVPVGISALKHGTNRRRSLLGKIADIDGFWTINSGVFLLQDLSGAVMEVAVYNFSREIFAKSFPAGRELCIIEPFFKIRADGSAGVRVDQPDTEILDYALPQTLEEWKELGNSFIKHCPNMALLCYENALQAPSRKIMGIIVKEQQAFGDDVKPSSVITNTSSKKKVSRKKSKPKERNKEAKQVSASSNADQDPKYLKLEFSKLLTNLSLCEFRLEDFNCSLFYATLAFGLGLDRYKAAYRIANALESKGMKKEAKNFATWYCSSYENGSATITSSILREEFNITDEDIGNAQGGASWVQVETLKQLASASARIKQVLTSPESKNGGSTVDEPSWLSTKQRGNDFFREKKFSKARTTYISALDECPFAKAALQDSSFVISNKGAAWLGVLAVSNASSGRTKSSMEINTGGIIAMFCASLMNVYGNGRAWIRVSRFLTSQGRIHDSTQFLEETANLLKNQSIKLQLLGYNDTIDPPLSALQCVEDELSILNNRSNSSKHIKRLSKTSTEEQLKQRREESPHENTDIDRSDEKVIDTEIAEAEQSYNMFLMMKNLGFNDNASNEMRNLAGPTFYRKLEDYSAELIKTRGIPEGLDENYATKILYRKFASDRLHPWSRTMGWRMAWSSSAKDIVLKEWLTSDAEVIRRWHGTLATALIAEDPHKYTQIGAVVDTRHLKPKSTSSYDSRIRSNYVNCPNRGEVLYAGRTHLAIGFNDLNSLINCKWSDTKETEHQGNPAHFVGLEMNEFNVAKTLVIAEMLTVPSIPSSSILQAWYSTVWSRDTLQYFKNCTQSVLEKGECKLAPHRRDTTDASSQAGWWQSDGFIARNVSNARVASYLHHWLSAEPVNYKQARRQWLRNTAKQNEKIFRGISSCKRRHDRIALAEYFLTGEVFGDNKFQSNNLNAVGSLPFWQCPKGSPPIEEDSIFNSFSLEDLTKTLLKNHKINIVEAFENLIISRLNHLRNLLVNNRLTIELYVGKVEPLSQARGRDLVRFVSDKVQPKTIGWSNVIDYFELTELHNIGRSMSQHGNVIHYAYSMNWATETFGAYIFDYEMTKNYEMANHILDMALGENFGGSNPKKINVLKDVGSRLGADEIFHCPDYDTPLNSTAYVAAQTTRQHWVKHFFGRAVSSASKPSNISSSNPPLCYNTNKNCGQIL